MWGRPESGPSAIFPAPVKPVAGGFAVARVVVLVR